MRRKIPLLLLFFSSLFYFCTEAPELTEKPSMNIANSPIVSKAQSLLKRCGDVVALTELKGKATSPTQSRAVEQTAYGIPLWEKATELENGEEKILMVPLEEENPRHSYVKMKKGNDIFRQFATSFSRLVVRTKGEQTIAHVLTYLPERKFARANAAALDTLGYHPEYIGYEGVVLVSSLNGSFKHGFLYDNGKAIMRLKHGYIHTEDCTDCSHSENSGTQMLFNISFYTETVKARGYSRSVETEEGDFTCSNCRQPADECTCFPIYGEYIYCDGCGMLQGNCICDLLTCPICGNYPCTCFDNTDYCSVCGSDPCVCGTEEYICSICNKIPCICDSEEPEIAPNAKRIFRNSNMTEQNWQIIENMLDKIIANCMGGNLYNAIVGHLNGKTLAIEFRTGSNGEFGFQNGTSKIVLGMQMESNQLFHEMWHAYQAYQETTTTWTNALLNLEIETWYAQYLYTSSLPEYKGSRWEQRDRTDPKRIQIKDIKIHVDSHGVLNSNTSQELLEDHILNYIIPTFREKGYGNYNYDYSRMGTNNFNNLNKLTVNCL